MPRSRRRSAAHPEAAINYASEKYGYLPESVADKGLLVTPDAPGQAGAVPKEPVVSAGDHQIAVKLGHGAVAVGNGRFLAAPTELADMHASWAKRRDARPSKIVYDPDTNTSHFEIEVDGQHARVEAQLAAKVLSFQGMAGVENRVVGGRISEALGVEILRSVGLGEHEMLRATGIGGDLVKPGDAVEFGLGRLHDGKCVIVIGGAHEIDWSAMPGIEPAGHTHPSTKGNDLRPDVHGHRAMAVEEMLDPSKTRHLNRQLVLPSAADFITMAQLGIKGHRVFTPFVVENGVVRKPGPGEHLPLLELTIGETKQVGTLATGERVFESTLEGTAGSETPITNRKIWVIEGKTETSALGQPHHGDSFVEFAEPAGLQRAAPTAAPKGGSKTRAALSAEMQKLARLHGDDAVAWPLASLPESDVAALLAVHTPLRDLLMKVPAVDARDLLAVVPEPELAKALIEGGPITAAQLARLRLMLGDTLAKDMILSAVAASKPAVPLKRLARIADGVEAASAQLGNAPLGNESLVLDSNARSALEDCQRGENKDKKVLNKFGDLDANYKDAIHAMRRANHRGPIPDAQPLPMTLEQLLWPGVDLRATEVAGAEAVAGEAKSGNRSSTLPHLRGIQPERGHKDYPAVVQELTKAAIGGPSGGPDRAIVADTLFTPSPSASLPTLVTVDELVYLRLARKFADPPITWPKPPKGSPEPTMADKLRLAPEASGGVFTISILGHKMNIRYM